MKRLTVNGLTAVLVSPGFGAGWSTWNQDVPELLFDPEIVNLVEQGAGGDAIVKLAQEKYPSAYLGGVDGLIVEWVPVGTQFIVNEYDGSESLEFKDVIRWISA